MCNWLICIYMKNEDFTLELVVIHLFDELN